VPRRVKARPVEHRNPSFLLMIVYCPTCGFCTKSFDPRARCTSKRRNRTGALFEISKIVSVPSAATTPSDFSLSIAAAGPSISD